MEKFTPLAKKIYTAAGSDKSHLCPKYVHHVSTKYVHHVSTKYVLNKEF